MTAWSSAIAGVWLISALHVALFAACVRLAAPPRTLWSPSATAYVAAVAVSTALPTAICTVWVDDHRCMVGTLTVSRLAAVWPWVAVFGALMLATAVAVRAATLELHAPRCANAAAFAVVCVGAFPDAGGVLSDLHNTALVLSSLVVLALAANGVSPCRGGGRAAVLRAHVAAGAAWAGLCVWCVWHSQPSPNKRLLGLIAETASLMHTAAAFV